MHLVSSCKIIEFSPSVILRSVDSRLRLTGDTSTQVCCLDSNDALLSSALPAFNFFCLCQDFFLRVDVAEIALRMTGSDLRHFMA